MNACKVISILAVLFLGSCAKLLKAQDFDHDGIVDISDLDDDNDGILDREEMFKLSPIDFSTFKLTHSTGASQTFTTDVSGDPLPATFTISAPYTVSGTPPTYTVRKDEISHAETLRFTYAGGLYIPGDAMGVDVDFSRAQKIYISADNTIFPTRITDMDAFTFVPRGSVSNAFRWIVLSSRLSAITSAGDSIRIAGTSSRTTAAHFTEFVIVPSEPIEGLTVIHEMLRRGAGENNGIFSFSYGQDDVDQDGMPNTLDTDSDADGCPDAIEGGANFTKADLGVNNDLSGGVNFYGVPTKAGPFGQEKGHSQHQDIYEYCLDTDGDGIVNLIDLDDDNDGILDNEEMYKPIAIDFSSFISTDSIEANQTFASDASGKPLPATITISPPYIVSGTPPPYLVRKDEISNAETLRFRYTGGLYRPGDAMGTDISFSRAEKIYISADNSVFSTAINYMDDFLFVPKGSISASFHWRVLSSSRAALTISGDTLSIVGTGNTPPYTEFVIVPSEPIEGLTMIHKMLRTGSGQNNGIFSFSFCDEDADKDGVPNTLDTDTDGDGCPDAIEGNGNISLFDIDGNQRLLGSVDAKGIPTAAGAKGQGRGDSQDVAKQSDKCSNCKQEAPVIYQP